MKQKEAHEPQGVACISYGKDSLAMLEAISRLGYRLDRIITAIEYATETIRCALPEVAEFQDRMDEVIKARYGIPVEHVTAEKDGKIQTFEDYFYQQMSERSKRAGQIRGWPFQRGCWVNVYLKTEPIRKAVHKTDIQYIGIAADEQRRIDKHKDKSNKSMPLVDIGWAEQDCMQWCKDNDMLSPVYTTFARDGCWFCMNQSIERLRWLRKTYPQLWAMMLRWDEDSPEQFKAQYSIAMIEKRMQLEDEGKIPVGKRIRWDKIREMSVIPPCFTNVN